MRVISKFLTADVEIVEVRLEGRKLIIEGLVKGFMPMVVETDLGDVGSMVRLATAPLRARLASLLPPRIGAVVHREESQAPNV